jgi:DNA-binding Lrp family transcriptional regulator
VKRILDPLDELIIAQLQLNGRAAHAELAAKVNLSRNAVRQRIERLERDGVIQGYTVRTGEGRQATSNINAVIFVYRYDRMRGAEVLQALRAIPEVIQCDVMSGEFDLMLRVGAASPQRVHKVWTENAALPGVENTVTSFVLSSVV